jgi:hypothetical protein
MSISNLLQTNDFVQRNNAKLAVSKWEKTGLLEGLRGETEKAGMAQLLENQARQLVKEATSTGTTAGSEEWAGVALPLVRRIFAEFAAKEFVSVQPMNLPSGLIFYLDFKYGTAQAGFDNDNNDRTGDPFSSPNADDSLFGVTTTEGEPEGGLYGAGRFGYSMNQFSGSAIAVTTASYATAASDSLAPYVNYDSRFVGTATTYYRVTITDANLALSSSNADFLGAAAFMISGSGLSPVNVLQQFTTYTTGSGITFITNAAPNTAGTTVTLFYNKQTTPVVNEVDEESQNETSNVDKISEYLKGSELNKNNLQSYLKRNKHLLLALN